VRWRTAAEIGRNHRISYSDAMHPEKKKSREQTLRAPAAKKVGAATAWLHATARAIAEYNARVAVDGVFGDDWRTF